MKQILYDTGPRVVARWSRERILKLSNSFLVERPPIPLKIEKNKFVLKCFLGHFECFKQLFFYRSCPPAPLSGQNFYWLKMIYMSYNKFCMIRVCE